MPSKPFGAKSLKWSPLNAVMPTTMNISRISSLTPTMIVLVRADSFTPAISTAAIGQDDEHGGDVDRAAVARWQGDRVGQRDGEQRVEQRR